VISVRYIEKWNLNASHDVPAPSANITKEKLFRKQFLPPNPCCMAAPNMAAPKDPTT
jgi:hypothetical protein